LTVGDKEPGPFSAKGDSGSVIVDGFGGILTGGSRLTDSSDMTYVTLIKFIMDVIHGFEPLAKAYIKDAQSANVSR
jgi:hypothetical protein